MANQELKQYIENASAKRVKPAAIRKALIDAGWKAEMVDEALRAFPHSEIRSSQVPTGAIISLFVLALLGGGWYYLSTYQPDIWGKITGTASKPTTISTQTRAKLTVTPNQRSYTAGQTIHLNVVALENQPIDAVLFEGHQSADGLDASPFSNLKEAAPFETDITIPEGTTGEYSVWAFVRHTAIVSSEEDVTTLQGTLTTK